MKRIMKLVAALAFVPALASASEESVRLDKAPVDLTNQASLQRGARVFVNYCLNCHSANYMRYSRLQDLGLSEDQIKENLLFTREKPGETMTIAMSKKDAKDWFGATPPDLTVIARSRGPDWLYTYLRSFYRDDSRPTGWNNVVFDKVGMPHVMATLQGEQIAHFRTEKEADGEERRVFDRFELVKPGSVSLAQYDAMVGDLVNYLAWMGEPAKEKRMTTGLFVLLFLGMFFIVAYYLKKEFWRDIH
ncbi:MAG TPA: cytochrome c1 [Thiobacillaceae bacterium]|nr:cytochrome c1 [Thiobacillaceae bacterium]